MKKIFIGIDFSKQTFDVAMFNAAKTNDVKQNKFPNTEEGCKALMKWLSSQTKLPRKQWLFCGEHTGLYSFTLAAFLTKKKVDIWIESALQIKQSQGVTREKNDALDACRIALYAYRFQDRLKPFELSSELISGIKDLMAYRERLINMKTTLSVPAKELNRVKPDNKTADYILTKSNTQITALETDLKDVEQKINELIKTDQQVLKNFEILTSVKGIGMVNAVTFLVATNNFTQFSDARKFACYCGAAPFAKQSGTTLKTKNRVSSLANKKIKSLLTQAAESAVRFNQTYKEYYLKKTQQGKHHFLVINNVRNKLIHLVFALVRSQTTYNMQFINPLSLQQTTQTNKN